MFRCSFVLWLLTSGNEKYFNTVKHESGIVGRKGFSKEQGEDRERGIDVTCSQLAKTTYSKRVYTSCVRIKSEIKQNKMKQNKSQRKTVKEGVSLTGYGSPC